MKAMSMMIKASDAAMPKSLLFDITIIKMLHN
jgi:hypothetical protein